MNLKKTKTDHIEKSAVKASNTWDHTNQQLVYSIPFSERISGISSESSQSSITGIQMLQRSMGNRAVNRLIQRKLNVGKPGDKYEQEADRVADQVMRMPEPTKQPDEDEKKLVQTKSLVSGITLLVQRQTPEEEESLQKKSSRADRLVQRESLEVEEEKKLQTKPVQPSVQREKKPEDEELLQRSGGGTQSETLDSVETSLSRSKGSGQPLSDDQRAFFEPRFGADFSDVKVHTGPESASLNQAVNAQAFTHGSDIYFGSGKYDSGTLEGKQLMAHELTHVVQQTGNSSLDRSVLQRWESSEHNYIGEQVYGPAEMEQHFKAIFGGEGGKKVAGTIRLKFYDKDISYSDVVALGDQFETFNDMYNAPKSEIEELLNIIKSERAILITDKNDKQVNGTISKGKKKSTSKFLDKDSPQKLAAIDEAFANATGFRYVDLAKKNYSHFTYVSSPDQKNNFDTWKVMHQKALDTATASNKSDLEKASKAFLNNAFADHYLSDTFASGHITGNSPGDEKIREQLRGMLRNVIAEVLQDKCSGSLLALYLFPIGSPMVKLIAALVIKLGIEGAAAYLASQPEIQKLPNKVVHDLDDEIGRLVENLDGNKWTTFGDKRLLAKENHENLERVIYAVWTSKQEVINAFEGKVEEPFKAEKLYPIKEAEKRKWDIIQARQKLKSIIEGNIGMIKMLWTDDDIVRTYLSKIKNDLEIEIMSPLEKSRLINILLGGITGVDDERSILRVLNCANTKGDIVEVVNDPRIGLDRLLYRIDGREFDRLLEILKVKYFKTMPLGTKKDYVLRSAKGYTRSWEEKFIKAIMNSSTGSDYTEIIALIDSKVSSESDDIIVDSFKDSKGKLQMDNVPGNLTTEQTVTICRALISGGCVGNDEAAVLMVLWKQSNDVFVKAVKILGADYIDSGLDGYNWNAFLASAAMKFPRSENLGVHLINKEKNDNAARLLVTWLKEKGKIEPMDWIRVIEALLSGNCDDDDENAILEIVRHLESVNKLDLVNTMIGESRMDSGVDGKQWKEMVQLMKDYNWS